MQTTVARNEASQLSVNMFSPSGEKAIDLTNEENRKSRKMLGDL